MLTHANLYSLEQYARIRPEFRAKVIAHKKSRRVGLGANATLYFEDALTMQYQVQEMLRLERVFESALIEEELAVYNPLIPDGANWKATFMLEYPNVEERKAALARLIGIERAVWMRVGELPVVRAIANEDLDRETGGKTSAVHFMRFELTPAMILAVKACAPILAGVDHPAYQVTVTIPEAVRGRLASDLT